MTKIDKNTFGYLGEEFQIKLIANIIKDKNFGDKIIDIIIPKYFTSWDLYFVFKKIKDIRDKEDYIIDMDNLILNIIKECKDMYSVKTFLNCLKKINEASLDDILKTQETALLFCKQQELLKAITEVQKIIATGKLEDYEVCEKIIKHTLKLAI